MAPDLLRELGGKEDDAPELVLIAAMPPDDLDRIPAGLPFLGVVFDRPTSPGNIGTLIRSIDAFGGSGLIVTGHAADPYDPAAVRASTGSLFAVPVVRPPSRGAVLEWVERQRDDGLDLAILGTDESGDLDLRDCTLGGPSLIVVGNETSGLSEGWRAACDRIARIPMTGTASSLNAATAGSIVLYEAFRQRIETREHPRPERRA
jgi:TrmH family RNA methyltransferase